MEMFLNLKCVLHEEFDDAFLPFYLKVCLFHEKYSLIDYISFHYIWDYIYILLWGILIYTCKKFWHMAIDTIFYLFLTNMSFL